MVSMDSMDQSMLTLKVQSKHSEERIQKAPLATEQAASMGQSMAYFPKCVECGTTPPALPNPTACLRRLRRREAVGQPVASGGWRLRRLRPQRQAHDQQAALSQKKWHQRHPDLPLHPLVRLPALPPWRRRNAFPALSHNPNSFNQTTQGICHLKGGNGLSRMCLRRSLLRVLGPGAANRWKTARTLLAAFGADRRQRRVSGRTKPKRV